jgi:beta-glucosidase/6-phospho-beta-glucosidase/beta-galactosidase
VDEIVAAGMTPVVTLLHFTWPKHFQDEGGSLPTPFRNASPTMPGRP